MSNNLKKIKIIYVQCIKSETPHEQCPTHRLVLNSDDDVRELAGIAP
jgi:hypothetical protein